MSLSTQRKNQTSKTQHSSAGASSVVQRGHRAVPLILVFAMLPIGVSCQASKADSVETPTDTPVVAPAPKVSVSSVAVSEQSVPKKLRLTGSLRGAKETDLAANVAGAVRATFAERGQSVKQGEVLARVDVRAATLSLNEANVQLENSRTQQAIALADCQRYEQLKQRGVVTDLEYDRVAAKCKTAPLSVEAAQARKSIVAKNVGDGTIRSPFTGVITERFIEVGEYVQPSSPVVSLAQVDTLILEFSLPEQHIPVVQTGAAIDFRVSAYPERNFPAQVTRISGAVRPTRDVLVEATLENPEGKLLPGMFAELDVVVGKETLPTVPLTSVFDKVGKRNVFIVRDGLLEQRVIQPAASTGQFLAIRRGVKLGEMVVTNNLSDLENGQAVQ